jgi:rhodanese-related sulfurtransferase
MTHGGVDPDGPSVSEISLADARARFDAGTAVFVDMRAGADFAAGHIPGALTITSAELDSRLRSLPPGAVIIAYGDAARPDSGRRGAQIFMELGYPEVIALEGGFQAWQAGGNPVE